jgi:dTDP-L-rhamnose 4-epimerase
VSILDNLSKPVHLKGKPQYLPEQVEFILGDVRDRAALLAALQGMDVVYHLAAYQDYLPDFSTFFAVNAVSTALIYELILEHRLAVKKVIVASSQSVAGEGLYRASNGQHFMPDMRGESQLAAGQWEINDHDGRPAGPIPTTEDCSNPQNPYGLSKLSQEKACISLGRRYNIPTVAMRYSIVQGPRQSFYNAYSGACRIFCLSVFFDKPPVIYEDGRQWRDFVNIHDVVAANLLVLDDQRANYRVFNVGGGRPYTIEEFAGIVCDAFGKKLPLEPSGLYRFGDTRHCISDTTALQSLGWRPARTAEDSVAEYVDYLKAQTDIEDILDYANKKMKEMNVVRKATRS